MIVKINVKRLWLSVKVHVKVNILQQQNYFGYKNEQLLHFWKFLHTSVLNENDVTNQSEMEPTNNPENYLCCSFYHVGLYTF